MSREVDEAQSSEVFARVEAVIDSAAASNTIFVDSFRANIFQISLGANNPIRNSGALIFTKGTVNIVGVRQATDGA